MPKNGAVAKVWTPEDGAAMDVAAKEFEAEFAKLPQTTQQAVAKLWKQFYMTAGHKRMGRYLVRLAK